MHVFKYKMKNKSSSIHNTSYKQRKYNKLRGEIYLLTTSNVVKLKCKSVLKKHKMEDLVDPNTCMFFNLT